MEAKPLTTEAIALTEKKMDMSLDDIIKMSKNNSKKPKNQRVPMQKRGQSFFNHAAPDKSLKAQRFLDSRASFRQAAFAQRRSSFQGNQFPATSETAKNTFTAPISYRPVNRSKHFVNKQRVGAQAVPQFVPNGGGFTMKKPFQPVGVAPKQNQNQKPQTLDSLFANMRERRMRVLSQQNSGSRRTGGPLRSIPWARNHLRY